MFKHLAVNVTSYRHDDRIRDLRLRQFCDCMAPQVMELWLWGEADIVKGRKVKAAQTPGPKPKAAKR